MLMDNQINFSAKYLSQQMELPKKINSGQGLKQQSYKLHIVLRTTRKRCEIFCYTVELFGTDANLKYKSREFGFVISMSLYFLRSFLVYRDFRGISPFSLGSSQIKTLGAQTLPSLGALAFRLL